MADTPDRRQGSTIFWEFFWKIIYGERRQSDRRSSADNANTTTTTTTSTFNGRGCGGNCNQGRRECDCREGEKKSA